MFVCVAVLVATSVMNNLHFKKLYHPARCPRLASYSYSGWNVETVFENFH